MTFNAGDRFRSYTVERLLGRGGVGEVWLMRHEILDRYFAVKLIEKRRFDIDEEAKARFLREARLAAKVRHPSLVSVYDAGLDPETKHYFLVMDYLAGGDVASRLAKVGRFTAREAASIVLTVAEALVELKKHGLVHRDVKPSNILYEANGKVRLADPGIVRESAFAGKTITQTGFALGTPAYMSFEQIMDSHQVDIRSDIYSLGVTFFELLTGTCPDGELSATKLLKKRMDGVGIPNAREVNKNVPAELADFIGRMTAMDVAGRVATPEEVVDRMKAFLGVKTGGAASGAKPRSPAATLLFVLSALFFAAAAAVWWMKPGVDKSVPPPVEEIPPSAEEIAPPVAELPYEAPMPEPVVVTNTVRLTETVTITNVREEVKTVVVTNVVEAAKNGDAGGFRFGDTDLLPELEYDGCVREPLIAADLREYVRLRKSGDEKAVQSRIRRYRMIVAASGEAGFDGCYLRYGARNRSVSARDLADFRAGKLFDMLTLLERHRENLLVRYFHIKRDAFKRGVITSRMTMSDFCALLSRAYGENLFPYFEKHQIHVEILSTAVKVGKMPTAEFFERR